MNTELTELDIDVTWEDPNPLLSSLVERALEVARRSDDARDALTTARAYLRILVRRADAPRGQLRLAADVTRKARAQARWLAATTVALQARANEVSLQAEGALAFPRLTEIQNELRHQRLLHRAGARRELRASVARSATRYSRKRTRDVYVIRTSPRIVPPAKVASSE